MHQQGGFNQGGGYGGPPGGPQGYGAPPPAGGPPGGEPPNNIGLIIAGVWLFLGVMGCLATGAAGVMSETLGMNISYIGVPLFVSGLASMGVAPFLRSKGANTAIGAPIGCGCASFLFTAVVVLVFYVAIWPSL